MASTILILFAVFNSIIVGTLSQPEWRPWFMKQLLPQGEGPNSRDISTKFDEALNGLREFLLQFKDKIFKGTLFGAHISTESPAKILHIEDPKTTDLSRQIDELRELDELLSYFRYINNHTSIGKLVERE